MVERIHARWLHNLRVRDSELLSRLGDFLKSMDCERGSGNVLVLEDAYKLMLYPGRDVMGRTCSAAVVTEMEKDFPSG